jgi:hypothetical protein
MPTKQVNEVTCDTCLLKEHHEHSWRLPKGWAKVTIQHFGANPKSENSEQIELTFCPDCWETAKHPPERAQSKIPAAVRKFFGWLPKLGG